MTVKDVCEFLSDHFEAPCAYTFNNVDAADLMIKYNSRYCDNHCNNGSAECWKRFLESWQKEKKKHDQRRQDPKPIP